MDRRFKALQKKWDTADAQENCPADDLELGISCGTVENLGRLLRLTEVTLNQLKKYATTIEDLEGMNHNDFEKAITFGRDFIRLRNHFFPEEKPDTQRKKRQPSLVEIHPKETNRVGPRAAAEPPLITIDHVDEGQHSRSREPTKYIGLRYNLRWLPYHAPRPHSSSSGAKEFFECDVFETIGHQK